MSDALPEALYQSMADLFALLAAPLRLRIVCSLSEGEQCVGELARQLGAEQSTLSRHLAMLYRGGVLGRRRQGAQVFYRVVDPRVEAVRRSVCDEIVCHRATGHEA